MANRKIFNTGVATKVKPADTLNAAGGRAYKTSDEHALAQYVVTSCFNKTFYASDTEQVEKVLQLSQSCSTDFLAKAAVYGHEVAGMKDTPALLLAILATRVKESPNAETIALFNGVFPRVVTNGKMLMNFVQVVRSGMAGRKSFGTVVKRAIRQWFEARTGNQIFTGSIGASPSFGDIIKMIHPKPESDEKKALYAYLIDRQYNAEDLPPKVKGLEAFKQAKQLGLKGTVPDVPFQMLTALNLTPAEWVEIAKNLPWNALRMNLNTLARHGVFNTKGMVDAVAAKLADPEQVRKFNVFPYQLLAAYQNTEGDVPQAVRNALQSAMEVATENVVDFGCEVAVCMDTSSSMQTPVTGHRKGSTTKMRCIDIAALAGATIARRNKKTILLPFDTRVHSAQSINPYDSIMTNATKLSGFGGGGTHCASALEWVLSNCIGQLPDLVIYVSDNESWFNSTGFSYLYRYGGYVGRGTPMAEAWEKYRKRNKGAKLVCIDINAHDNVQVADQPNVLNIGGFSDKVWTAVKTFHESGEGNFVGLVKATEI